MLIDHHFSLQRKYRQIILERVSRYKISNRTFFIARCIYSSGVKLQTAVMS